MKKILLLIPFILLSMIGYSQKNLYGDMKVWGKLENVDTTKIKKGILFGDTTFQNTAFIPDSIVHWSDTITKIATKHDLDTLSNSIYDSLSNHYDLIHALDTGKVSTSGDVMYGKLTINADLEVNGGVFVSTIPLGTDIDSVLTMENGQLKSVDGSSFKPDSTSSGCFNNFYYKQITGCDVNNLYIKADTTKFSNYIKYNQLFAQLPFKQEIFLIFT